MIPEPEPGELITRRHAYYAEVETADLSEVMHHLDVSLYRRATYGLWASPEAGFFSRDIEDLKRQIQAKEDKLVTYRAACDEIWLVMYALVLPSGGFDIDALGGERIASPFDHVVFVDAVSGNYVLHAS